MLSRVAARGLRQVQKKPVSGSGSPSVVLSCGLTSKAMRDPDYQRPKPFDYENKNFNMWDTFYDKTTLRFDENSKLIIVDGAHCVGKTDVAKQLAEEFDLKHIPQISHDMWYKDGYGIDLRDYKEYLEPRNIPFDDQDFLRNPVGDVEGSCDRYLQRNFLMKLEQYMDALKHIFNTGQGVVLEQNVYSDYTVWDAALKAGWVHKTSVGWQTAACARSLVHLMRPNVVIYLDAPVDVVQRKVAKSGNEVDKNSPVFKNTKFLNDIYTAMKRDYLREIQNHSQVLVYDWSEPGDMEVVVEDVEGLNLDTYGLYEEQQSDWRLRSEDDAAKKRMIFSNVKWNFMIWGDIITMDYYNAPHLTLTAEETFNLTHLTGHMKGQEYHYGFNKHLGDPEPMFQFKTYKHLKGMSRALPSLAPPRGWMTGKGF